MDNNWKQDPRLKAMDPEKVTLLTGFAEKISVAGGKGLAAPRGQYGYRLPRPAVSLGGIRAAGGPGNERISCGGCGEFQSVSNAAERVGEGCGF